MDEGRPDLPTRLLFGALAGLVATGAMTAAMWRLHRRLPEPERYPLPPREITGQLMKGEPEPTVRDTAMVAHFAYGAASGALVAGLDERPSLSKGAALGASIWAASYFGWVPAFRILRPASEHPARRNALMIGVHLIWGAATALTVRELFAARATILNDRPPRDAQLRHPD